MNSEAIIRSLDYPADLPAVLALWQAAGPGISLGKSDESAELEKKFSRDPELFLVAEQDGNIVGAVLGGFDGRRGLVYHLAVAPALRKAGIGSLLMEELETRLRSLGCIRSYLLVKPGNEETLEFYRKRGWVEMDLHLFGKDLS